MLVYAVLQAVNSLFRIVEFLIIANALVSWFPVFWQNPTLSKIMQMINVLTEPILKPVRKLLSKTPVGSMPIDIAPIITILLLSVLQNILVIILVAVIG
ncbi:MAG: YggT family protein [Clostridia bacterium]|nr:YggT family protein [Clostridia bacterium]